MTIKSIHIKIVFTVLAAVIGVSVGFLGGMATNHSSWETQGTVVAVRPIQDQHGAHYLAIMVKYPNGTMVDNYGPTGTHEQQPTPPGTILEQVMPVSMGRCWENAIFQIRKDGHNPFGVDERCISPNSH